MSPNGSKPPTDELNQHGKRVQELVAEIDALPDSHARELFQECMQEVLAFYGIGLDRVLEVARSVTGNQNAYEKLVNDSLIRGLLLIHGLHPVPLEARMHEALAKVRPYMESHGGNVELLSLENDAARLRLVGHCKSCPSSAVTLELALRQAIEEACPDLISFQCEGVSETPSDHESHVPNVAPSWIALDGVEGLAEGRLISIHAAGVPLILCKAAGQLYAYRDRCPACNMPLHLGALDRTLLSCRAGHRYDVKHAGRSVDSADLHLDPFPLLISDNTVKVALPTEQPDVPTAEEEPAPTG